MATPGPVSREQLNTMLADVPEAEHEQFLQHLKGQGYTLAGSGPAPRPDAATTAGQRPIYPQQAEIKPGAAAWESIKGAWNTPIPGLNQVGEFMANTLPGMIAEKGGQMGATQNNPGIADKATLLATVIGTAGEMIPRTVGQGAMAFGVGPALSLGKKVASLAPVRAIAGGAGDLIADLASAWTGKPREVIQEAFKNPEMVTKMGHAIGTDIQASAVSKIEEGKKLLGKQFSAIQDSLAQFAIGNRKGVVKVNTPSVINEVSQSLESLGHKIPKELGGGKNLSLKEAALTPNSPEYNTVTGYLGRLKKELDFGEALNLRRDLDNSINYGISGNQGLQKTTGATNNALRTIRKSLDKRMTDAVPDAQKLEWATANRNYANGMRAYDQLNKEVIGKTPYQTALRTARALKQGRTGEIMDSPAAKLGQAAHAAMDELRMSVAASHFKSWATGSSGSNLIPSSPRLVGYTAAGAGALADMLKASVTATGSLPPGLIAAITKMVGG